MGVVGLLGSEPHSERRGRRVAVGGPLVAEVEVLSRRDVLVRLGLDDAATFILSLDDGAGLHSDDGESGGDETEEDRAGDLHDESLSLVCVWYAANGKFRAMLITTDNCWLI